MPCCDTNCFQSYLDEFSLEKPAEFKVIILDNGAFHQANRLEIPANIASPYSPELNPAEKMWAFFKSKTAMTIFRDLEKLLETLASIIIEQVTFDKVKSISGNRFYQNTFKNCFDV
jgi:transposase